MINVSALEFGKKHGLQFTGNTVFGRYSDQVISIETSASRIYEILFLIKDPKTDLLNQLKNSPALKEVGFNNAFSKIDEQTLHFSILPKHIKKGGPFEHLVNLVVEELQKSQHFTNKEKVILVNRAPRLSDNTGKINLPELTKPLNFSKGVLYGLSASIVSGLLMAVLHYFLLIKGGKSLVPIYTGFIVGSIILIATAKGAGRLGVSSALTIPVLTMFSYLIHLISVQYLSQRDHGILVPLSTMFGDVASNFKARPIYHLSSLLFPLVQTMAIIGNQKTKIETGFPITNQTLAAHRSHYLGSTILAAFLGISFLYFLTMMIYITTGSNPFSRTIDLMSFLNIALLVQVSFVTVLYLLTKISSTLHDGASKLGTRPLGAFGRFVSLNVLCIFTSLGSVALLIKLNQTFDSSKPSIHQTNIINGTPMSFKKPSDYCYHVKHWDRPQKIGEMKLCQSEYGELKKDEPVEISVKNGALGAPWINSLRVLRYRDFGTFLRSLTTEADLRFTEMKYFYLKDQQETSNSYFKEKIATWEKQCNEKQDFSCRFIAYLANFKNDPKREVEFLERACTSGDLTGCYGLYLSTASTSEQKARYPTLLTSKCNAGDTEACLRYSGVLWQEDYEKNYPLLVSINEKACESTNEKEACENLKQLKKYPVKK